MMSQIFTISFQYFFTKKETMSKLKTARQEAFDASTRESELRHHIENSKIIQERMARDLKTAESQISGGWWISYYCF